MQLASTEIFERLLPEKMFGKLRPSLEKLDAIVHGSDDDAQSQRNALTVFTIRVASAAIALFSQVILARWMGVFEYGIFVAVWAGIMILASLITLGLPSVLVRFIAEYRESQRPSLVRGVIRGSMIASLTISTLFTVLGCAVLVYAGDHITHYFLIPIFLALLCLPAFSVEDMASASSRPFNWVNLAFLPPFVIRPVAILFFAGIAILAGYPATATTAMWCALFACYCVSLTQAFLFFSRLKKAVSSARPKYRLKQWLLVALPIFLVESFYTLVTQVDVIFVSWLTNPEETAIYFAAAKILALVHFVYFAVRAAASHRFAAFMSSGRMEEYRDFVQKTVAWTFWPSLFLGLLMVVTGQYFLMMFGPEYVVGTTVVWILLLGIMIRASVGPAEAILVMSGKQNICAVVYSSALFVNITLNLSLIPTYGMEGAAIATAFAMAVESAALYSILKRKLGIHAFFIPQWSRKPDATGGLA